MFTRSQRLKVLIIVTSVVLGWGIADVTGLPIVGLIAAVVAAWGATRMTAV